MLNSGLMRLGVATLVLCATAWVVESWRTPGRAQPPSRDLATFPMRLDRWKGRASAVDPRMIEQSGAYDVEQRIYRNPTGGEVSLHLAVWTRYHTTPHHPRECYKTSGWELEAPPQQVMLPLTKGKRGKARLMVWRRQSTRAGVLYWYEGAGTHMLDHEDYRAWEQSRRRFGKRSTRPPLVKVMLYTELFDGDRGRARLEELGALVAQRLPGFE